MQPAKSKRQNIDSEPLCSGLHAFRNVLHLPLCKALCDQRHSVAPRVHENMEQMCSKVLTLAAEVFLPLQQQAETPL